MINQSIYEPRILQDWYYIEIGDYFNMTKGALTEYRYGLFITMEIPWYAFIFIIAWITDKTFKLFVKQKDENGIERKK